MGNKGGGIKVINNGPCPIETINGFNRRIAEMIAMKYPKEVVEEIISEYEKKNQKIS